MADYNRAIELDPLWPEPQIARGFLFGKQDLYELALADFDEVIARAPDAGEAYFGRGLAHRALGDHAAAEEDFMMAFALGVESKLLDERLREMGVIE
jgi:tetratricopeptide (TPR) repeat protein